MRITDMYVFFWTGKDVYSNFYRRDFVHQDINFKWSEQAVMYRKALLFGAEDVAEKILEAKDPMSCKKLGQSRKIPFVQKVWDENRLKIYEEVLIDKFSIKELRDQLLNTGNRKIAEASPYDDIWGIKLREDDPRVLDETKWKGQNLLGKVLMRVREHHRKL